MSSTLDLNSVGLIFIYFSSWVADRPKTNPGTTLTTSYY